MSPFRNESFDRALGLSLKMLRARDRFSTEIRAGLETHGVQNSTIAEVLDYLVHKGLVRDDLLAERLAQHAVTSKIWGPNRIRQELERRLAPAESIERALSLIPCESDLLQRALAKLGDRPIASLARRLHAEGFSAETISAVIESR